MRTPSENWKQHLVYRTVDVSATNQTKPRCNQFTARYSNRDTKENIFHKNEIRNNPKKLTKPNLTLFETCLELTVTRFCIKLLTGDCLQNALLAITFEIIYIEWFSINIKTYFIKCSTVCTLHLEAFCTTALLLLLHWSLHLIWLIIH